MSEYDLGVYIGRFQPFHLGHEKVVLDALKKCDQVLILIGSCNQAPSIKNPFDYRTRQAMITYSCPEINDAVLHGHLRFEAMSDHFYDEDLWLSDVVSLTHLHAPEGSRIALFGSDKDESTYYLHKFPDWAQEFSTASTHDATTIRNSFFNNLDFDITNPKIEVPGVRNVVAGMMRVWGAILPDLYFKLAAEYDAVTEANKEYGEGPFKAADALVEYNGHYLLVSRGGNVGRDLAAMPGGFADEGETSEQTALRELKEETGLDLLELDEENFTRGDIFEANCPSRSVRNVTSTVHHFIVKRTPEIHQRILSLKAADDANKIFLIPKDSTVLLEPIFFEDHGEILRHYSNQNKEQEVA